jgi:hypothetical protein
VRRDGFPLFGGHGLRALVAYSTGNGADSYRL